MAAAEADHHITRRSAVKRLTFKRHYLPLVVSGRKTQTIRRWVKPRVKSGDMVLIPGAGVAEIISVEEVELASLDNTDAKLEGFSSVEELIKALRKIYGVVGPFWRVRFRMLPKSMQKRLIND